jgi:hypothetical protein
MYLSLRTTIFWNIFVLMALTIALISFVVFRITEKEIYKQRTLSGEMIFSSIQSSLSSILLQKPGLLNSPSQVSEIQDLFFHFAGNGICTTLLLVDNNGTVIAHSDKNKTGQAMSDMDIQKAMSLKKVYKKIYSATSNTDPQLVVCGPLYLKSRPAGFLKAAFSLHDAQQSVKSSFKMMLLYILFDAVIMLAFGTFLLSRYLVKPVKKLIRLTEDISEGNLDGTLLSLSDRNEFGKLSTSLKDMSKKLIQEKAKIEQQYHALEEKNLQLQQAHKEILQTEKLASVGSLAAGIAHEVGNPVGIILGCIHLLRSNDIDDKKRTDFLNRMESATERVNSIIRELLDYAQPSSQEIQEIILNDIIKDTYSLVSYKKEFSNIDPVFHLAEDIPQLYADEKQIRQLIVNLVLNAGDAMPDGGRLTFTTGLDRSGKEDKILFTISDTGQGITVEKQNQIFDPFFTTKQQGKGTGLGLSNVQRIVESAGGHISVSSRLGEGTTFTITLPFTGPKNTDKV